MGREKEIENKISESTENKDIEDSVVQEEEPVNQVESNNGGYKDEDENPENDLTPKDVRKDQRDVFDERSSENANQLILEDDHQRNENDFSEKADAEDSLAHTNEIRNESEFEGIPSENKLIDDKREHTDERRHAENEMESNDDEIENPTFGESEHSDLEIDDRESKSEQNDSAVDEAVYNGWDD